MNISATESNLARLRAAKIPHVSAMQIDYLQGGSEFEDTTLPADANPFYRVYAELQPAEGSFIRVVVLLPEQWNERYVGYGNGGMAGTINCKLVYSTAKYGYVSAHTDMGTSRGRNSGAHNPEVWKDFGWRATHLMTETAKLLAEVLYGRLPRYSYFIGMSTGGEQAMAEAQRFPQDYDGIYAGVPAFNRIYLHIYFLWMYRLLRVQEKPIFADAELTEIARHAVTFHQQRGDGAPGDLFLTQPVSSETDIAAFIAYLRTQMTLSEEQYAVLQQLYEGPRNPRTGKQIYNGVPVGSEAMPGGMLMKNDPQVPNSYPFYWAFGADYDLFSFDFDRDMTYIAEQLNNDLNANDTDLSAFMHRGGKLLMASGVADPLVPYPDAVRYYNAVCTRFGFAQTQQFFRFFLLPGKDHSNNGDGVNVWGSDSLYGRLDAFFAEPFQQHTEMLNMLVDWVENDRAPDQMATVRVEPKESPEKCCFGRPVYPYPAKSSYIGGDPTKPTSFAQTAGEFLQLPVCEYV